MRYRHYTLILAALLLAAPAHAWEKTIPVEIVTYKDEPGTNTMRAAFAVEARKKAIAYAPRFIGNYEQLRDNDLEETFLQVSGGYIFSENHRIEEYEEISEDRVRIKGTVDVYVDEEYMEQRVREVIRQAREGDLDEAREKGGYNFVMGHPREGQTVEERVEEADKRGPDYVVTEEEALAEERHLEKPPSPEERKKEAERAENWSKFWNGILGSAVFFGLAALM